MPHWRTMIEREYIGSWDIAGRDVTVEISAVESVSVKSREVPKGKRKVVLTFVRTQKKMIANATNCETIEGLYGPDTDRWVGQRITLYVTQVRSPKGGQIPGIRIRPRAPSGKAEAVESRPVDEAVRAEQDAAFSREREPGEDDE